MGVLKNKNLTIVSIFHIKIVVVFFFYIKCVWHGWRVLIVSVVIQICWLLAHLSTAFSQLLCPWSYDILVRAGCVRCPFQKLSTTSSGRKVNMAERGERKSQCYYWTLHSTCNAQGQHTLLEPIYYAAGNLFNNFVYFARKAWFLPNILQSRIFQWNILPCPWHMIPHLLFLLPQTPQISAWGLSLLMQVLKTLKHIYLFFKITFLVFRNSQNIFPSFPSQTRK